MIGSWPVAGVCRKFGLRSHWLVWLFGHSVGGLFDCIQDNFYEDLHAFVRGVSDSFDCSAGILIFLLSSFFFFSILETAVL